MSLVSIILVTWNSRDYLEWCKNGIAGQNHAQLEVIIVDNGSSDGTQQWLMREWSEARFIFLDGNYGFCRAVNIGLTYATGEYVLLLNPDVTLAENYIKNLCLAMESFPRAAIMAGKLLRSSGPGLPPLHPPIIDSAGLCFRRNLRHFDRGSQEVDRGQYDTMEEIFGASGAAMFIRRGVIKDIATDGQFLDEDFFAYREDADVCWRTRLLGWRIYYVPDATAYHVRRVFANNRKETPAVINMHSVKNRFLMRFKNMTWDVCRATFFPALLRDIVVIGACLTVERLSLPGLLHVVKHLKPTMAKRRSIFSKMPRPVPSLSRWFNDRPVSIPVAGCMFNVGDRQ